MNFIFLSGENNGLLVVSLCIWLDVSSFAQKNTKFAARMFDFCSALGSHYFSNGYSVFCF